MLSLIVFIVLLATVTYAIKPASQVSRGSRTANNHTSNPFQGRVRTPPSQPQDHNTNRSSLTRCHNCSVFFPAGQVVHEVVQGHLLEFCSKNCRNNFHGPQV